MAGRPGGVSGYPRAWYQVSFVSSNPLECILVLIRGDCFSCAQVDFREALERELSTTHSTKNRPAAASGIFGVGPNLNLFLKFVFCRTCQPSTSLRYSCGRDSFYGFAARRMQPAVDINVLICDCSSCRIQYVYPLERTPLL